MSRFGRCRSRRARALLRPLAVALLPLFPPASPANAQDLVVQGCDERLPGEVGVAVLQGSVGQMISVPVTVNADTPLEAFTLHVDLPVGVLSYVRTDPGSLIGPSDWLDGFYFPATNRVRVVGLAASGAPIPAGSVGSLAVLVFQVTAAGSGAFGTSDLQDNLSGYVSCEDAHGTSAVEFVPWGRMKAAYR